MSSSLSPLHLPRRHIVPTHLNLPDQVLTLWSFSLTARQLLLLLVGAGLGGTIWQHLAVLGQYAVPGQALRLLLALLPFLLTLFVACYQYAGRSLEVWCVIGSVPPATSGAASALMRSISIHWYLEGMPLIEKRILPALTASRP
jgi:hypothetical protein